jgi:transposase
MGLLLMSDKERLRKAVFEMVKQSKITLALAAAQCDLSYRQAIRLYRRYINLGDAGLAHQARGKASNYRHADRAEILFLYREKYDGFGPTLASEKLEEDDKLIVDHDTLRMWLLEENLWCRKRKRSAYRRQRERKAQFGEMVQMDGSIHDWLEDSTHRCLLNMVDDATGKTLSHLDNGETTRCVFSTVWVWIKRYGIPLAFYIDFKNVYISKKNIGHFERACAKLGIRIIKAHSPQAKGRVERNHGVYQDRFVKELRLKGVKTVDGANAVLEGGFIDKLNQKFEKQARNPQSAHRPLNEIDLNQILCWEYERQVENDYTFSFKKKCYQIKKAYGFAMKPKVQVCVRHHLDGTISAWYKNERLSISELPERPKIANQKLLNENVISFSERGKLGKINSSWDESNSDLFKTKNPPGIKSMSNMHKKSRKFASPPKSGG